MIKSEDFQLTEDGIIAPEAQPEFKGYLNGYPIYTIGPYNEVCNWIVCTKHLKYSKKYRPYALACFKSQDDMETIMQGDLKESDI